MSNRGSRVTPVYVILRNDDPCALSNAAHESRILECFERYGIPQVLAVTPCVVDDPHDHRLTTYHPLEEHPQLVELLKEYQAKGLVEIAQHGFTHQTNALRPSRVLDVKSYRGIDRLWLPDEPAHPEGYSEFNGLPVEVQRDKVARGRQYLEALFGVAPETFVFPWNTLNRPCLEVLRECGFRYVPCGTDEPAVPELQLIGACSWMQPLEEFREYLNAVLSFGQPALLQVAYHSWMLTDADILKLENVLRFIAQEPYITCLTPRQIPQVIPDAHEFVARRLYTTQLAAEISRFLPTPHREVRNFYVLDRWYYRKRIAQLRLGLLLVKRLGIRRSLGMATVVFLAVAAVILDRYVAGGDLGPRYAGTLALASFLGGAAWLAWRRERRRSGFRGLISRGFGAARELMEVVAERVRCSFIETLRERSVRYVRTRGRQSVQPDDRVSACVLEESAGWGGAEVHTAALIKHLVKRGYRVEYLCGRNNALAERTQSSGERLKAFDSADVHVIQSSLCVYDDQDTEKRWLQQLASLKSHVLFFSSLDVTFGTVPFFRACRRTFRRVVYIEHTVPPSMPPMQRPRYLGSRIPGIGWWWHKERLRRRFRSRCADRIVAVSEDVRKRFIESWGCSPDSIVTIRNGVDWRAFQVTEAMRAQARSRYRVRSDAVVFGMLTRLSPEKGVDIAVEAFRVLQATAPAKAAYLVIAGEGPEGPALEALAAKYGLADRIRFVGFVAQPMDSLPLFDAIVLSSRFEGLPLALLEGMAAGAVPIVARVGGMTEVINEPGLGWVVPPEDVTALAEAMAEVLALSPSAIAQFRHRLLERVRTAFDETAHYDALLQVAELAAPQR